MDTEKRAERYLHRGVALQGIGKNDLAADAFVHALAIDPDLAPAHDGLVIALLRLDRHAEAEAEAREVLRLNPQSARAHYLLGIATYEQRKLTVAEEHMRQAIGLDPATPEYHIIQAEVFRLRGRAAEALASAERAIQIYPDTARGYAVKALALLRLRRLPAAEDAARTALSRNPSDPLVHNTLGVILLNRLRAREAHQCFRETLRLDPTHRQAQHNLLLTARITHPLIAPFWTFNTWPGRPRLLLPITTFVLIALAIGTVDAPDALAIAVRLCLAYLFCYGLLNRIVQLALQRGWISTP